MANNKKILIITYYWPPSGGPGVQRWLKMSWYLAELGCDITILSIDPEYANFPHRDEQLMDAVHPSIKVHRTRAFNPYSLLERIMGKKRMPAANFSKPKAGRLKFELLTFLRSHIFIPDPRRGWNGHAYKGAVELMRETKFDHLITTSPPHSSQLIGRRLKREFGVHWITDFRDPWTDIFYYGQLGHSWLTKLIDKSYEKKVILESDLIFTVGLTLVDVWRKKLISWDAANQVDKVKVLTNGYDERDFSQLKRGKESEMFSIVYTGTLSSTYNYEVIFDVLGELMTSEPDFQVDIYGRIPLDIQQDILNRCSCVSFHEEVSHSDINQLQMDCELLLLILADVPNAHLILSGKLFEYLRAGVQILNLGPKNGDAARVIAECNAGKTFERDEQENIKQFFISAFSVFRMENTPRFMDEKIQAYSRATLAKQVLDYLG